MCRCLQVITCQWWCIAGRGLLVSEALGKHMSTGKSPLRCRCKSKQHAEINHSSHSWFLKLQCIRKANKKKLLSKLWVYSKDKTKINSRHICVTQRHISEDHTKLASLSSLTNWHQHLPLPATPGSCGGHRRASPRAGRRGAGWDTAGPLGWRCWPAACAPSTGTETGDSVGPHRSLPLQVKHDSHPC